MQLHSRQPVRNLQWQFMHSTGCQFHIRNTSADKWSCWIMTDKLQKAFRAYAETAALSLRKEYSCPTGEQKKMIICSTSRWLEVSTPTYMYNGYLYLGSSKILFPYPPENLCPRHRHILPCTSKLPQLHFIKRCKYRIYSVITLGFLSLEWLQKTESVLWNFAILHILPSPNIPKILDLSYKTDLEFWNCFGRKNTPSYSQRNTVTAIRSIILIYGNCIAYPVVDVFLTIHKRRTFWACSVSDKFSLSKYSISSFGNLRAVANSFHLGATFAPSTFASFLFSLTSGGPVSSLPVKSRNQKSVYSFKDNVYTFRGSNSAIFFFASLFDQGQL